MFEDNKNNIQIGDNDLIKNENDNHSNNNLQSNPHVTFHFTTEKAGMQGLNREEIDRIILEATKGSSITKKKIEDMEKIKLIVEDYKVRLENLYKNEILFEQNKRLAEARLKELKKDRILDRVWMHIDMDMFYAAVEIRDRPELKNKPIAVGNERMVSTSNYIARKYGVRSAMPGFLAKKLCKDLIFVPLNFYKYEIESKKIMQILKQYDPNIDVRGLDEAFLDLTNFCKNNYITTENELRELMKEIKLKIFEATQLTSSCGIACNKMLAKICSDIEKPDGLFILPNDVEIIENFIINLKVRKIPFVGEKLENKLNLMNIFTCGDVLRRYVDIYYLLSENQFDFLLSSCYGIGPSYHEEIRDSINKSISCSETFRVTSDIDFISKIFHDLCKRLYLNMIEQSVIAKTLTVEIKDKNERHLVKSLSIIKRFETQAELVKNGWNLLKSMLDGGGVRLIRLKISSLHQVNPETLKKKSENHIKNWINKLQDKEEKKNSKMESKLERPLSKSNKNIKVADNNTKSKSLTKLEKQDKIRTNSTNKTPNKYNTIDNLFNKVKLDQMQDISNINKLDSAESNSQNLKRKSNNKSTRKNKRSKKTQYKNNTSNNGSLDTFIRKSEKINYCNIKVEKEDF